MQVFIVHYALNNNNQYLHQIPPFFLSPIWLSDIIPPKNGKGKSLKGKYLELTTSFIAVIPSVKDPVILYTMNKHVCKLYKIYKLVTSESSSESERRGRA